MELMIFLWLYDRKFLLGLPYAGRAVVEYALLIPALFNLGFGGMAFYVKFHKYNSFSSVISHYTEYHVMSSLSLVSCIILVLSPWLTRPVLKVSAKNKDTNNDEIMDRILSAREYYWNRRYSK